MTFEEVFSFDHMLNAAHECTHGVMWKQSTQNMWANRYSVIAQLQQELMSGKYKSKGFKTFMINERGKTRRIQAVHISERIVQKTLREYCLAPILEPKLIYDNAASIKGKGTHFAIDRFKKHLGTHVRRWGVVGGVLTLDLHNYFGSIDHEIMKKQLRDVIEDDRLYNLSAYFVDCFDGDAGLGLGSEVSQAYAMYYPNAVDHYIKEQLHIKGYGRYNDDSYLIHRDIDYLHYCLDTIQEMDADLKLELNPKKTQIHRIGKESIPFLKRRFSVTDTGKIIEKIERKNVTRRRRLLKKQAALLDEGRADSKSISQSYQSWRSYASGADSYKTVHNMDNLYNELVIKNWRYDHDEY